ncbi:MAG: hypothetical protein QM535_04305 [Limnohabitans sp.]|nr:hypothetical protein [Limnohabitans sp.]
MLALVDYIKIKLKGSCFEWLKQKLSFQMIVDEETGEIKSWISKYMFCDIIIKPNKIDSSKPHIYFKGSIHKLWNEINGIKAPNYRGERNYKGYNGNQYYFSDFEKTIQHLEELFNCKSNKMIIENIEFGLNLEIDFEPNWFIDGLLFHHNKRFDTRYNGTYKESKHLRFIYKIYNKSLQYGISRPVIRVELKIKKMIEIKNLKIKSLADINQNTFNLALKLIINRLNEIVYYDYTISKDLPKKYSKDIAKLKDVNYWLNDLKSNRRDRPKKKLNEIIENHSDNLKGKLIYLIQKCVIINR